MQLTLLPTVILLAAFGAAASQNFSVAKPNCLDSCNGIPIPFPFGTNESCYHSRGFWVTCNESLDNPPKLFWQDSSIEIKSILLSGQMLVMQFIAHDYGYNNNNNPYIRLADNFTVNSTGNKFTVVGCDAFGTIYGLRHGRNYTTGCTAMCGSLDDLVKDSCTGSGCCQTSIPPDATAMYIKVGSINNYTQVKNFSDATFGFFVEINSFKFSPDNLANLRKVKKMPMLLDWATGNSTCEDAQKSSSEYACKSTNSRCYKPETGDGYRCSCEDGYDGNPYLIDGCQDIDECQQVPPKCKHQHRCSNTQGSFRCHCPRWYRGDGKVDGTGCTLDDRIIVKIVTGVASGIIFLLLAAWLVSVQINRRRLRRLRDEHFVQNGGKKFEQEFTEHNKQCSPDNIVKIFEISELKKATKNFHSSTFLGQGAFGRVFKGKLDDDREVAIKKPRAFDDKEVEQFTAEAFVLSQINHKFIVKLLGCCFETEIPLLVYEFISNGDLASYIHDAEKSPLLNWDMRLRIAHQTAQVLSYLHSRKPQPIIHRDIKSQNILLDRAFITKVADFGASRLVPQEETPHQTRVIGTLGYVDPEYRNTHQLTTKSDVYGFGVVLFELLTGKWPIIEDEDKEQQSLVEPFLSVMQQPNSHESVFQQVDAQIVTKGNEGQIIQVAKLALWCLKEKGVDRPSMENVENELQKLRLERQSSLVKTEESQTRV